MDSVVDSLNNAHQEFVAAAANVLEAKELSEGQKLNQCMPQMLHWKILSRGSELFRVACDQVEEFVESVKQRIGSECLVDEATGSSYDWKNGSGAAAAAAQAHPSAPFDARFPEDAAQ
ncbi:hypothetical protein Tsubulata_009704 [Turnera subulata]|uniref:Uncharacterized protein n=1 Tax=Turnera subulata TaxID=218843 RepID=A0A9Q0F4V7_9ROSI|nr:hypothetical protein Tsubulata_009704 [Turnera subulata]